MYVCICVFVHMGIHNVLSIVFTSIYAFNYVTCRYINTCMHYVHIHNVTFENLNSFKKSLFVHGTWIIPLKVLHEEIY